MKKIFIATVLLLIAFSMVYATEENHDPDPPVTTKMYSNSTLGVFGVPSCNGAVSVNVDFITTSTAITLNATDTGENATGVNATFYMVLIPTECQVGSFVEWIGDITLDVYESEEACLAANETQNCVQTYWELKEELMRGNRLLTYNNPFVIPQESTHKICFFSVDNHGNSEQLHCQVAVVDDNPPEIHSADVDHHKIDIETYSGGDGSLYFADPKCTMVTVNTTDTHEIDEVQAGVIDVLRKMFINLEPDSQDALNGYYADQMHNMPAFNSIGNDIYQYWFCPGKHIYHLYDMDVLSYDNFTKFLMEDLALGEFELPIWVNDTTGKEAHTSVNITIVDLTVPLEVGWNLRSTPVTLEGNKFWPSGSIDAVLRWNSTTQSWQLVTDNNINPLDALYIHATSRNQIGYVFERDLTSPPVRHLGEQWNLVGMALPLTDYWYAPSYCDNPFDEDYYDDDGEYGDYYAGYCYLTYLSSDYKNTREAFLPVIYDAEGNRALRVVISPQQSLSYGDAWASWYFYQYPDNYVPRITSGNADPTNSGFGMINFGGYWAFMQNDALLPGFTTTPLPLYGD